MPNSPPLHSRSTYSTFEASDRHRQAETLENEDRDGVLPDELDPLLNKTGNDLRPGRNASNQSDDAALCELEPSLSLDVEESLVALPSKGEDKPITWMSLPHKSQLAILAIARLSEPLVQSSLRSYLFYQLRSFDKSLPDSTIASQAGIIQGAFAAAQLCTAMVWGRMSDQRGRKSVILLGLSGSMLSCIGFGFSTTFTQALVFRSLGGALNGNVGVMRTMISEIIREKKFQSRAFILLPMVANIGVIIGPMLGGLTSDPVSAYPSLFGGIKWLERFPYSPPNILSAIFLASAALAVWLGLEETHHAFSHRPDWGIISSRKATSFYRKLQRRKDGYLSVSDSDVDTLVPELPIPSKSPKLARPNYPNRLPLNRLFTSNVITVLISHSLLAAAMGTFQSIFYTFLSTPVYDPAHPLPGYTPHLPLKFTGGVGLSPRSIGFAMATLGTIGIVLQIFLYPAINARLGTVPSYRIYLYCFPIVYTLVPFLSIIPSTTPPPSQKTGPIFWTALTFIVFLFVMGRTFASPAAQILVNNCCPHPTVLGTVHGIGQSVSAAARTVGPALGGWIYGVGLEKGVVGATFWALAGFATLSCVASNFVREGNGHEIRLEGDDEAEAEAEAANALLR